MTVIERRQGHIGRLPTDEQVETIVQILRAGNYVKTAAEYVGLNPGNIHAWLREGAREDGREWCQEFYHQVQQARAYAQAANLQVIQKAAQAGVWQAAAWFLERSDPQRWGLRERREVEILLSERPRDQRGQLEHALAQLGEELNGVIDVEVADEPQSQGEAESAATGAPSGPAVEVGRSADRSSGSGRLVVRRTA